MSGEYGRLVSRIRTIVETLVPEHATILVVSRGDDALLEFDGPKGWHFPQAGTGRYAGYHPADSAVAISHLEEQRAAGADHLVFPSTRRELGHPLRTRQTGHFERRKCQA